MTRSTRVLVSMVLTLSWLPGEAADLPQTYLHPAGFSLRYPADWRLQPGDESVALVPPGEAAGAYFLVAERLTTRLEPTAPEVVQGLDQQVRGLAPYLARQGEGTAVATGVGPGQRYLWEGTGPGGQPVQFRVYVAVAADHLVQLTAVGPTAILGQEQPLADAIFGSLSAGTPPAAGTPGAGTNPLGGTDPLGQNPPAAAQAPFAGRFSGGGFDLELQAAGEGYRGTLKVGDQTFPVTAEPRGASLYGNFTVGGTQYLFAAKLDGEVLEVTSDGNTHRLTRVGAAPGIPSLPAGGGTAGGAPTAGGPATGGDWTGSYLAQMPNGSHRLHLVQAGQQVTGTLTLANGVVWKVTAQLENGLLKGTAADDQAAIYFEGQHAGPQLTLTFMETDGQTGQPKRETAQAMTFQRETAAAPLPQPGGVPGQPTAVPGPAQSPAGAVEGKPLQAGVMYQAGERVAIQTCGVSFAVPAGYRAQYPEQGAGVVLGDGKGHMVVVTGMSIVPEAPTAQQLAAEFGAQLLAPGLLGEGMQFELVSQPEFQANRVVASLQGNGPAGALSGHIIGVVSPGGPNEGLVFALGSAGDGEIRRVAEEVANSLGFGRPGVDLTPWHQQLPGRKLLNNGSGSHSRTSPTTTLSRENQTAIALGVDGRYQYQYIATGLITTPGGMGGNYDTSNKEQGRYRIFAGPTGPGLLLLPDGDGQETRIYSLAVDGNTLLLNGTPFSLN